MRLTCTHARGGQEARWATSHLRVGTVLTQHKEDLNVSYCAALCYVVLCCVVLTQHNTPQRTTTKYNTTHNTTNEPNECPYYGFGFRGDKGRGGTFHHYVETVLTQRGGEDTFHLGRVNMLNMPIVRCRGPG